MIAIQRLIGPAWLVCWVASGASAWGDEPPQPRSPLTTPPSVIKLSVAAQVSTAAMSPDGTLVAIGTQSGEVTLWEAKTGLLKQTFRSVRSPKPPAPGLQAERAFHWGDHAWQIDLIAFDPKGEAIALKTDSGVDVLGPPEFGHLLLQPLTSTLEVWRIAEHRKVAMIETAVREVRVLALLAAPSEEGNAGLVTIDSDSRYSIWEAKPAVRSYQFGERQPRDYHAPDDGYGTGCVAFAAAKGRAASVLVLGDPNLDDPIPPPPTLRLWDSLVPNLRLVEPPDSFGTLAVALTADGGLVATAAPTWLGLIDFATAQSVGKIDFGGDLSPRFLSFRPDGGQVLATNKEGAVRVYDVAKRRLAWSAQGTAGDVWAAHWFADRVFIVTGGRRNVGAQESEPITLTTLAIPKS